MNETKPKITKDEKYFDTLRRRFEAKNEAAAILARKRADLQKSFNETPFSKKLKEQK